MYEIENGVYTVNYIPKNKLPVAEFLKTQGRFKHLFKAGNEQKFSKFPISFFR